MSDYSYDAVVRSVHDGDTIAVDVDAGFDLWIHGMKLRLYGINAPELATPEGKKAQAALVAIIPVGSAVVIETIKDKTEKYGRMLAKISTPAVPDVNAKMVALGQAKAYFGVGPKPV